MTFVHVLFCLLITCSLIYCIFLALYSCNLLRKSSHCFLSKHIVKNMFYDAIWPILRACGLLVLWRCLADDKQETELISYNQYFLVKSFLAVMVKMLNKLLYCYIVVLSWHVFNETACLDRNGRLQPFWGMHDPHDLLRLQLCHMCGHWSATPRNRWFLVCRQADL